MKNHPLLSKVLAKIQQLWIQTKNRSQNHHLGKIHMFKRKHLRSKKVGKSKQMRTIFRMLSLRIWISASIRRRLLMSWASRLALKFRRGPFHISSMEGMFLVQPRQVLVRHLRTWLLLLSCSEKHTFHLKTVLEYLWSLRQESSHFRTINGPETCFNTTTRHTEWSSAEPKEPQSHSNLKRV